MSYTPEEVNAYLGHVHDTYGDSYTPEEFQAFANHIREQNGVPASHAPVLKNSDIQNALNPTGAKGYSVPETPTPLMVPGSKENPRVVTEEGQPVDIYGGDADRLKASLGNLAGVSTMLKSKGWKDAALGKNGFMAQAPSGEYFADKPGFINSAEASAGQALPVAGAIGGGIAGGGPYSIPAAGLGMAFGERLRSMLGQAVGTYENGSPRTEMLAKIPEGMAGEATGQLAGKAMNATRVPYQDYYMPSPNSPGYVNKGLSQKEILDALVNKTKKGIANVSGWSLHKNPEASLRVLNRPDQVMSVSEADIPELATQAKEAAATVKTTEKKTSGDARLAFQEKFGSAPVNTAEHIAAIDEVLKNNAQNPAGLSGLSDAEIAELQRVRQSLMSTVQVSPPVQAQKFGYEQGERFQRTVPGEVYQTAPAQTVDIPAQSAGNIQKTADYTQGEVGKAARKDVVSPSVKGGKSSGALKLITGKIKDTLHNISTPLKLADKRAETSIDMSNRLTGLENPVTQESFIHNLFGKDKTEVQRGLQWVLEQGRGLQPGEGQALYNKIADQAANQELTNKNPLIGWNNLSRVGLPALLGYGTSHLSGNNDAGLAVGILSGLAAQPAAHRYALWAIGKYGLPTAMKMLQAAGYAVPRAVGQEAYRQSPWSLGAQLQ